MKPRRVVVTLEITTDTLMIYLRDKDDWQHCIEHHFDADADVHCVQVDIIKPEKGGKKGCPRS